VELFDVEKLDVNVRIVLIVWSLVVGVEGVASASTI
jgi:hypothetical protein